MTDHVLRQAVLRHVGLATPYRFERLLAALAALVLLLAVLATAAGFVVADELARYTPREAYFWYLAGLALAGVVLAPWPRAAVVAIALGTVDLALGVGSHLLAEADLAPSSILPTNYTLDRRFQWHPLLQATPIPSISVEVTGFRVTHSSQSTRGREHSPAELAGKSVVAVFGGSATYDIAVGDDETWPARLEARLGAKTFAVINHGVPGYSTVEHVVQTAFYQDKFGATPRCALYFVGWNDLRNTHVTDIDPGYARFHLPSQIDALQARRFGGSFISISPALTLAVRLVTVATDTVGPPRTIEGEPKADNDPVLEALFVRNVRSISAINRDRGIRTIWVGQILNLAAFDDDEVDGWIPLVRSRDVWPLLSRLNGQLASAAAGLGDAYLHVPIGAFRPADFRDNGHFVASGSDKFASRIAPEVARLCR
jgi:hypothetical protein